MATRATPVHPVTLISARIDRAIAPGEVRFLEAHLRSCPSCQHTEAELRSIWDRLTGLPIDAPPPGAVDRLISGLRDSNDTRPETIGIAPTETAPTRRVRPMTLLVPAALVLAIAGVWLGTQRRSSLPVPRRAHANDQSAAGPPSVQTSRRLASAAWREREPAVRTDTIDAPPDAVSTASVVAERVRVATPRVAAKASAPIAPPAVAAPDPDHGPSPLTAQAVLADAIETATPDPIASSIRFGGNGKRLNREARRTVEAVAEFLHQNKDVTLAIEARTDPRRSAEKTLELGRKRALAVASYLEELGVDPSRLHQVTYDNESESTSDDDDDDRNARNDRVDLVPRR